MPQEMRSNLAQFRVDDGEEPVARVLIPLPPVGEPPGDLLGT